MALRTMIARRFLSTSAFSSQFGAAASNLTAAGSTASDKPAPVPSDTLFVSGLNKRTTSETLHEAFVKFGQVVHAKVVTDRNTGFSKGFGFVKYASIEDAAKGIEGMDAKFLEGWVIFAEYARPRPPQGQTAPQNPYAQRS
ncbi:organelle RRM domain-containing protein 2, mitochondrial-like [Punica granatum]|uniref:Organelle RRM domain-containing protein 2, mitochondrial-like n=2 Tax=Punica granatum TaxID=22663 RepID=A0A6P8DQ82_PUNGR|nr:organelle RRM domain-containing protein 2, mitochondrial-like [Punica granatum]PKI39388.1 hypothetical protein CRG98_040254 [Punica granatum]